ncbi:MAG: hypothetical protein MJ223_01030 [Mycoplasmoidaceae bacterium]|nr:hypothetical protein [Mycoplasmoidaceae bacterium]
MAGLASTDDAREQKGNLNAEGDNVDIYEFSDGSSNYSPVPLRNTRETKEKLSALDVPVGFNGIYTMNKTGKPITSGVSTYSYTGMYPGSSVYKSNGQSNQFTTILMNGSNLSIAALMSCVDDMTYDGVNTYYQANYNYLTDAIEDTEYKSIIEDHFIPLLIDTFGDTTMITAICGATDVAATDLVYDNLISTFNLAETSVIAIIIPITIIIVAIISNLIINDSKKMTAMLKALGYSDIKNLMSILALFIPTMVLGLGLAIPLTLGLTLGYQSIVFSSANILVDVTQKW